MAATYTYTVKTTYNGSQIASETRNNSAPTISYGGSTIVGGFTGTKTLTCANKIATSNIVVGGKTLTCNGKYMLSNVTVNSSRAANPVYLYKPGDQCTSITGGWSSYPRKFFSNVDGYKSASVQSGYLQCGYNDVFSYSSSIITANKIDCSGFSQINMDFIFNHHNGYETDDAFMCALRTMNTGIAWENGVAGYFGPCWKNQPKPFVRRTMSMSLSGLQGSYYIHLCMWDWGYTYIYNIWLS